MNQKQHYFMPAEWETHERTFIEWPVREAMVWPENYDEVCKAYAAVALAISEFEEVSLIVNEDSCEEAKRLCRDAVKYLALAHNDGWCRDNGPTFLWDQDRRLSAVNWQFNAWGERFFPYALDNEVAPGILKHYKVPYFDAPIVLEGGSIHTDGEGTLLTTRECLLNKNRNPELNREQIEEEVKHYTGTDKILWLNRGLYGDETDGHIDNVACFAKPGVILLQTCSDPKDPNYERTRENLDILKHAADARGRRLQVIEIEQAPASYYREVRLTLSYLNFYMVNGGIILPVFGGAAAQTDEAAIRTLQEVFPNRKIVPVDGMALIKEGGNVHCITQQMPAGTR